MPSLTSKEWRVRAERAERDRDRLMRAIRGEIDPHDAHADESIAKALDSIETRHPYHCDCSYPGAVSPHLCCSACGDDWDDCVCGAPVDPDAALLEGLTS